MRRPVNGGCRIEREYGLGRGRTALLVLWPGEAGQPYDLWWRFMIECKVLRDSARRSMEATIERGIEQTLAWRSPSARSLRAPDAEWPSGRCRRRPGNVATNACQARSLLGSS